MSQKTNLDGLAKAVEQTLNEYAGVILGDLEESSADTATSCAQEIKSNALGYGWKDYAKTWSKTKERASTKSSCKWIVYAKKPGYRLAHLLENGHAKRNGGRVRAYPHIAPAEAHAEEKFIRLLRQKIGGN